MSQPAVPLRVVWEGIANPQLYEDMVSCLLSILHPNSVRTDGSGGDGGRDVHFDGPDGLEIFELKSFTGRVVGNRRAQLKRSYAKAMGHSPAAWTLVVPIDPTEAEQRWFAALTSQSIARCTWLGKTQLNAAMAQHPCVPRYYLHDVNDEIRHLAELFHAEQAALSGGVTDALARIQSIAGQLDELDPFYLVDIRVDTATGSAGCSLSPRYLGADRDRPISMQAHLVFPDEVAMNAARQSLQATFDFGVATNIPADFVRAVHVDAPAGLGGQFQGGNLTVGPNVLTGTPEQQLNLRVSDPDGAHLTILGLRGRAHTIGQRGLISDATDESGSLTAQLQLDWVELSLHMTYQVNVQPAQPAVLLPLLRFLVAARKPNQLTWVLPDGTELGPPSPAAKDEALVDERWLRSVETLARVQAAAGVWFAMPDELSAQDAEDLWVADQLLACRIVDGTWSRFEPEMHGADARTYLEHLSGLTGDITKPVSLHKVTEQNLTLAGNNVPLGR